jgi:ribose transport system substrate-binding protein
MMRQILPPSAVLALACCLGIGCRSSSYRRVISAIPHNGAEADCVAEHAGLADAARRHELSVYWNGPTGSNDNEQQIALMEAAIRKKYLGIILTPTAPFAMDTVIERALALRIPVVIFSAPIVLPSDPNLSFVLNDFQRSGTLAAERVYALIGNKGEVAIAGIDPMSPGTVTCARAFEEALRRSAPGVRIVSRLTGSYTTGQTETALEHVLNEHPLIRAVYSLNPGVTHGVVAAVRDFHPARRIVVIGNDQAIDLLFLVRERLVDGLVIQDMPDMGAQAVEDVVAMKGHRPVPRVSTYEPILVTADNIDTEPVQRMLKMDWRPDQ